MGLRISTNMASINAQRSLVGTQREISKNYAQLSSGSRITKSADDSAGLAISENLKSQIRSYQQAQRNAGDGLSMIQVSEGGLGEISNILTRLRELGIQAASDTVGERERGFIDKEVQQLKLEAQRIAESTRYGDTKLLDGSGGIFSFQVDIHNNDFQDRISFNAGEQNATSSELGIDGIDYTSKGGARSALDTIDQAMNKISGHRATLGAIQNRLMSTSDNIGSAVENLSSANARIRDADIAQSSADLTRNHVLLQASTGVLAQANQMPGLALKLIG